MSVIRISNAIWIPNVEEGARSSAECDLKITFDYLSTPYLKGVLFFNRQCMAKL